MQRIECVRRNRRRSSGMHWRCRCRIWPVIRMPHFRCLAIGRPGVDAKIDCLWNLRKIGRGQSSGTASVKWWSNSITDFFRQRFLSVQVVVEIGMIWDAQQWQITRLRWSNGSGRFIRITHGWLRCSALPYGCIAWWLLWWIVSGLMEGRCLLGNPPRWGSGRPGCRCGRRWRPRKSSGRRLNNLEARRWCGTVSRREGERWLNCRRVERFVLNQFHKVCQRLHHSRQIAFAQPWWTIVRLRDGHYRSRIHYRRNRCILEVLPRRRCCSLQTKRKG